MVLTVLGSGTVVPQPERASSGYFVETGGVRLLMDCGSGVVRNMARFGLPWSGLSHVLLSHFHTDHVGELPSLLFALKYALPAPRTDALDIIGPLGTRDLVQRMAAAFGNHVVEPGFELHVRELVPGDTLVLGDGTRLSCRATPHTDALLAYRFETGGRTLGYTGDTGMDAGLADFCRGVDALVIECSLPDERAMDTHLTPTRVAQIAAAAMPRQLVLTHVYPLVDVLDLPSRLRMNGWHGGAVLAGDGMRILV